VISEKEIPDHGRILTRRIRKRAEMNTTTFPAERSSLSASHTEDLKLAASKMRGAQRRSFQAEITLKYCGGSARWAETVLGWGRHTVELGLHEKRTGVICMGAQEAYCGSHLWEDKHPEVARALWELAQSHSQQDPTFRTTLSYTRLTAAEALKQLGDLGFAQDVLPSPSTMAAVLNRNGYRLRPVVKAKPQKKSQKRTSSSPTSRKRTGKGLTQARPSA
jgi:hypothetical protein